MKVIVWFHSNSDLISRVIDGTDNDREDSDEEDESDEELSEEESGRNYHYVVDDDDNEDDLRMRIRVAAVRSQAPQVRFSQLCRMLSFDFTSAIMV